MTDFPLYVKISSDADIGAHAQSDGDDIRFTLADGVTVIPHETESFSIDSGDATGHFWVKVPTINSSSTTDIYIYYGNSEASNGDDPNNVWDSNFKGVWHMDDTGNEADSSGNGETLTETSGTIPTATGKIGSARDFERDDTEYLYHADDGSTDIYGADQPVTVSAWVTRESDSGTTEYIACKYRTTDSQRGYALLVYGSGSDPASALISSIGSNYARAYGDDTISTGSTWYNLTMVYDDTDIRVYVDGQLDSYSPYNPLTYSSGIYGNTSGFTVGAVGNISNYWDGLIDEVRVSDTNRSADWIKFEYRNVAEADNELTFSSEEEAPEVVEPSDMVGNPYMFTGRRFDLETGLYYYRARYYNPYIGRFLQTDPAYSSINLYAYCGNNPLNYTDPSGLTVSPYLVDDPCGVCLGYTVLTYFLTPDELLKAYKIEKITVGDFIIPPKPLYSPLVNIVLKKVAGWAARRHNDELIQMSHGWGCKVYLIFVVQKRHWYPPFSKYWDIYNPILVEIRGGQKWAAFGTDGSYGEISHAQEMGDVMQQLYGCSGDEIMLGGRWRSNF